MGDENTAAECLAPKVTIFQPDPATYSSQQTLALMRERYRALQSEPRLELHAGNFHVIGEAIWFEYEVNPTASQDPHHTGGMALCHKLNGRWRIVTLAPATQEIETSAEK